MLNEETLRQAYNLLCRLLPATSYEPFDSVRNAEMHRWFWKPERVKTVILAESHVFTPVEESEQRMVYPKFLEQLPTEYVRLVYCLGYGEQGALGIQMPKKTGTPQYWKLFAYAAGQNPVLVQKTGTTNTIERLHNKWALLCALKEKGVWLLDTSILGLANLPSGKPGKDMLDEILYQSWQCYIAPIIEAERPEKILCVGKGLWGMLRGELKRKTPQADWVYQPNARLSKHAIEENQQKIATFCV